MEVSFFRKGEPSFITPLHIVQPDISTTLFTGRYGHPVSFRRQSRILHVLLRLADGSHHLAGAIYLNQLVLVSGGAPPVNESLTFRHGGPTAIAVDEKRRAADLKRRERKRDCEQAWVGANSPVDKMPGKRIDGSLELRIFLRKESGSVAVDQQVDGVLNGSGGAKDDSLLLWQEVGANEPNFSRVAFEDELRVTALIGDLVQSALEVSKNNGAVCPPGSPAKATRCVTDRGFGAGVRC